MERAQDSGFKSINRRLSEIARTPGGQWECLVSGMNDVEPLKLQVVQGVLHGWRQPGRTGALDFDSTLNIRH
jgi:hypothetical protein